MSDVVSRKRGRLILVGIHIGNPRDTSPRAAEALAVADVVACEERREGARLLRYFQLEKPLVEVNEHTERNATEELLLQLATGSTIALVSDCGMPVFADPGTHLVSSALETGIRVDVIPGPTSLTTALAISGLDTRRFYFYGFLSPKRAERRAELAVLRSFRDVMIFLDAPYRLLQVLDDMAFAFGGSRRACVACDMTTPGELVRRGTLKQVEQFFKQLGGKREFVLIVEGNHDRKYGRR